MIFRLQVNTDGAAFEDDRELSRILHHVADRIESGEDIGQYLTIFDQNGNSCGQFALKPDWYR